jgi:hypothetical protein
MSILWCGGEDIDFPNGNPPIVTSTGGGFRAGYARCGLIPNISASQSATFAGGAVTSCWLSFREWWEVNGSNLGASTKIIGLTKSGTSGSGIWLSSPAAGGNRLAICKYDGSTRTELVVESGFSYPHGTLLRFDIQVISYGASGTVNVYLNGVLVVTYTGNIAVSGVSDLDRIWLLGGHDPAYGGGFSEIIVADEDTRAFPGLVTLALTGAGTTDDWTGAYTQINGTVISDASPVYVNTNNKDEQFNVTDLPSGAFRIKAVKLAARAAVSSSGATPTKIALGYNSGGTVAVEADQTLTTAYDTYESISQVNPVTSAEFVQSDMNALQINVRSKA